jgi:hypothetical protein
MMTAPDEYGDYVKAMAAEFPRLNPLHDFMNRTAPENCQPDNITVFDLSTTGELDTSEFCTVNNEVEGGSALMEKLKSTTQGLADRIVVVSHLTPITARVLGLRYDLSADLLNAHLPSAYAKDSQSLARSTGSPLSFHLDAFDAYCIDKASANSMVPPPGRLYGGFSFSPLQLPISRALGRWYFRPGCFVPHILDADRRRDVLWLLLKQSISVHSVTEGGVRTVLVMLYPPPLLTDRIPTDTLSATPIAARKRLESVTTPSRWRSLVESDGVDNARLSSPGQHLCSLLQANLQGTEHGSEVALQQVFALLHSSFLATAAQVEQRVDELGNLSKIQSEDEVDVNHGAYLLGMAAAARNIRSWASDAVDLLGLVSQRSLACGNTNLDAKWDHLKFQFNDVFRRLENLVDKSQQLSQTRLVYVQIAESRKAIEQADSVRRLTTLAFIFIPLTYVASVFGAELSDMNDTRNAPTFAVASIGTTLATILAALYLEQHIWPAVKSRLNAWRAMCTVL